jgi:uncharacterized membrane protein
MSLSPIGIFHTLIGIIALISGFMILWKNKRISFVPELGKIYLISTFITAASSLTIFKHGSFNPAHALAILTLLAVVVGMGFEKTVLFKSWNKYMVNLCYSSTILFHLIPTATEILTRFPMDAPLVNSLNDPLLHKTFLAIFIVFMVFLILQMKWLRSKKN